MDKEKSKEHEHEAVIEDLTLNEVEAENVKGGVFSFAKGGLSGALCDRCKGSLHSGDCS